MDEEAQKGQIMQTKICSNCGIEKSIIEFYKDKDCEMKAKSACKKCYKNRMKQYRLNNKQKIAKHDKKYYQNHKEKIKIRNKIYKENNKEKIKQYYQVNREKILKLTKFYQKNNREVRRKWENNKCKIDLNYRLSKNLRRRLSLALEGKDKSVSITKLVGCSIEKLKQHIKSLWKPGMSWKNWGHRGWHLDHIKPCCQFDLSKSEEQRKCFHYINLQPLWAEENLSKGGKLNYESR